MKTCSKCKLSKPYSDFSKGSNNGYSSYCKPCASAYYKEKNPNRKRHGSYRCRGCDKEFTLSEFKKPRDKYRYPYCRECKSLLQHVRNLSRYNMTQDQYVALLKSQGGVCAICGGTDNKRLSVDHDHSCCAEGSCGKCVRGLLCSHCNRTLGMVKDDIETLKRMIRYLSL